MKGKLLHESDYWTIYWHDNAKCLHFIFSSATGDMDVEEYLEELKTYISLTKEYKPLNIYADTREFAFTITPDVQEFIDENILALYSKIGTEKHAVIVSKDLFASVSVEQTMDENAGDQTFKNEYFDDPEQAEKWLGL